MLLEESDAATSKFNEKIKDANQSTSFKRNATSVFKSDSSTRNAIKIF